MAFEESKLEIPELERDANMIAAAGQIVMELESKKRLTNYAMKTLKDLSIKLSSMTKSSEKEEEEVRVSATAFEDRLIAIDEKIMRWEEVHSLIWDSGPDEASEYLNAADEVRGLIKKLENLHLSKEDQEYKFLHKAYGILQTAMARLEEEFRNLLIQSREHFESEFLNSTSNEDGTFGESLGDGLYRESFQTDTASRASQEYILDLVHPDVILRSVRCIVKALESKKSLINVAKKILEDLRMQLSSMTKTSEKEEEEERVSATAFEDRRLIAIDEIIMRWEEGQSLIWDSGPDEASEYLHAAYEVRGLIEKLENLHLSKEDQEYKFLHKAYGILQTVMARLEEEFRNLLIQYREHFESEYLNSTSNKDGSFGESLGDGSYGESLDDGSYAESFRTDTVSRASQEYLLDLVHPDVILRSIRCIANLMFACNYEQQCSHAYTMARRDALDNWFLTLEMERMSIENVLRMERLSIRRWISTVRIFVKEYLARERGLSEQIFGEGEAVSLVCFVDASRTSILQLLNFGDAATIGPHKPEKLFRILDMYEFLASLMPDIETLYPDEVGSSVRLECDEVLKRLGNCVRVTFLELDNSIASIASNTSTTTVLDGGLHPLTRYIMNYVRTLTDYSETLNLLLKHQEEQDAILLSLDMSLGTKEGRKSQGSPCRVSSMALPFKSIASVLERDLYDKSKLYKEAALQHLFLMNNIHYMAQKVNGSEELRLIYGDEWLREHRLKFLQHEVNYLRTSFSSIVSLLKFKGVEMPSLVKEKLKSFYLAFEGLYKIQTAWLIPDADLREDLQITLSNHVIPAYKSFVKKSSSCISDKHVKYTTDDLEKYLFDFFEGAPKSLQNRHRK